MDYVVAVVVTILIHAESRSYGLGASHTAGRYTEVPLRARLVYYISISYKYHVTQRGSVSMRVTCESNSHIISSPSDSHGLSDPGLTCYIEGNSQMSINFSRDYFIGMSIVYPL